MASLLIRGGTLLPMTDDARPVRGDVLVQGRRIARLGAVEAPADATVIDASGAFVMPGLVQTHVHLVQTLFRGLAEDLPLLEWLVRRVWPLEAAHDEVSLRASVRLGQAMMDAGEGVPAKLKETTRASLDASAALQKRWDGHDNGRIRYAYAPRFALSCTRELLEAVAMLSKMTGTLVHTHSNESADERALIERATGRAPAAYLADVGIASERTVVAHAVHVDADELALLAATRTAIAHCPSSNLKLGSGIADVARLRGARLVVGLGSDGAACNNRLDLFEEARLATLLSRAVAGLGALTAGDALLMATRDGARALGLADEIGTLEEGKRADLVVLDGARLAPGGDAAARIVFGGGARAVRDVLVDGEALVRDFRPTRYDPVEVRAKADEATPALLERARALGLS